MRLDREENDKLPFHLNVLYALPALLSQQIARIGVSVQSNNPKSNPLLDLSRKPIEQLCAVFESYFDPSQKLGTEHKGENAKSGDVMAAVALMESLENILASFAVNNRSQNAVTLSEKHDKCLIYHKLLGKSFLNSLTHLKSYENDQVQYKCSEKSTKCKETDSYGKTMVMIRAATAYLFVQKQAQTSRTMTITTEALSSTIKEQLTYLVDFALVVVSSSAGIETNGKETLNKPNDIKRCFRLLKAVCQH